MRAQFRPSDLFTLFIIATLVTAVTVASQWTLRASIIVLVLGSIGAVLATGQLLLDLFTRSREKPKANLKYELPNIQADDPRKAVRGAIEIWAWLLALVVSIPLIGLPVALPLFVLVYIRFYGGSWIMAVVLAALIVGFIYGVYQQIMHVYWPENFLADWLFPN